MIHHSSKDIVLRFDNVSFSYGETKALDAASFHVHQGEFIALVGANGAGKTTTLKLILGLERPESGSVFLFGETGGKERGNTPRIDKAGYVPQQAAYDKAFPVSVEGVVRMGRLRSLSRKFTAEDRNAITEALEQVGLRHVAKRPYNALSGGERRRVLLARALASKPPLLILDEPTANMDAESEERLFHTLGALKGSATILIVTHDRDFVSSLVDRALCIEKGKIVQHELGAVDQENLHVLHKESIPGDACL
ncbi:MAG: metal ABC transporter ATP-binding protein [Treponema sp.]|jgi:zinc transport system ATP-binding protein|nr:metal ABC transporter ATP-binding protein [Treponema sp.]